MSGIVNSTGAVSGVIGTTVGTVSAGIADPGSSTDEALLRWNGASGDTVADSAVKVDDTGRMTNTTQPAFSVYPSSSQQNFAVDSTVIVVWGTEIYDIGSNFASNTFTAPVNGKYSLSVFLTIENMQSSGEYYQIGLLTNNRNFYAFFDPDMINEAGSGSNSFGMSVVAHLDATHTAHVTVRHSGSGAHADIADGSSFFSGFLVG